jgi:general secretion pathway protein H
MPTSATGDRDAGARAARGFTLIELLVTLVILAVIAGVLVVSVGSAGNEPRLKLEAERLKARVDLACERAELTGREIGVHFGSGMYGFSQRVGDAMQLQNQPPLKTYPLPGGLRISLPEVELTDGLPAEPQLLCFASGERTPATVVFDSGARDPEFRVVVETMRGRLQRRAPGGDWLDVEVHR